MFFCQYQNSLDENNLLEVPENFREALAGKVIVTQGFERNLLVLPLEYFQGLCRLISGLNIADPLTRSLQKLLIGNASFCEIDSSGKIILTDYLKNFAGLKSTVISVGIGKYYEVWSQEHWHEQENILQDAQTNSTRFASVDLSGL